MDRYFLFPLGLALALTSSFLVANPFNEEKIGLSYTALLMPRIHTKEKDLLPQKEKTTGGLTFMVDLPVYRFLHSGFLCRYVVSPKEGEIGGILDLGGLIKPLYSFTTKLGHFGVYVSGITGFSVTFMPIINKVFVDNAEGDREPIRKHVNVFGGLFNASAKAGLEYYPHEQIGIFLEGGFAYWYFLHQIDEQLFKPTFKMFSYHLTAPIIDAGVKYTF